MTTKRKVVNKDLKEFPSLLVFSNYMISSVAQTLGQPVI